MKFEKGTIIKLINPHGVKGGKFGDLAQVVDGRECFPELHKELKKELARYSISDKEVNNLFESFVWIKWTASYPYRPENDGAYYESRFETLKQEKR